MTSYTSLQPVHPKGAALPVDLGPSRQRVHLSGEVHTGAFSIVEFSATPEVEPENFCETEDRFFCLLEGEWEVRVGEDQFQAKAGASFHAPPGTAYEYRVISPFGRAVVLLTHPSSAMPV